MRVVDAIQFLWRWEMAGNPCDPARWHALDEFAHTVMPRAAAALVDLHVVLVDANSGDGVASEARLAQMEELARAERYADESFVPEVSRGLAAFAHDDFAGAIDRPRRCSARPSASAAVAGPSTTSWNSRPYAPASKPDAMTSCSACSRCGAGAGAGAGSRGARSTVPT